MKLSIVIITLLFFAAYVKGQSPTVRLNIKMEVLPELKELFKDTDMQVWYFSDTSENKRKAFRDTISLQVPADSCIGLYIYIYAVKGTFSKRYSHIYEIPCLPADSIKDIVLQFPADCEYNRRGMNDTCPKCRKKDKVIPIWYGLPVYRVDKHGSPVKEPEHYSRGCIVSDCDPGWYCKRDKYEF